jgi:hypothetical protein
VTPAKRGRGSKRLAQGDSDEPTPAERRASITPDQVRSRLWAQRLKRVFDIAIETCQACGGAVRIIASIEDPVVIEKILTHLAKKDPIVRRPGDTRANLRKGFLCRLFSVSKRLNRCCLQQNPS